MPESLKRLIELISYLPGIGEKTATKLGFFLLKTHPNYLKNFSESLMNVTTQVDECSHCHGLKDSAMEACSICKDASRDDSLLCVVEDYLDLLSLEKIGVFQGKFHVLGGVISPVSGTKSEDLSIHSLIEKVSTAKIKEIILALNPTIEGEATALYIIDRLKPFNIPMSRLSKGLPNAGSIEYADEITLINALRGRK